MSGITGLRHDSDVLVMRIAGVMYLNVGGDAGIVQLEPVQFGPAVMFKQTRGRGGKNEELT